MENGIKKIKILTPHSLGNDWIEIDDIISQSFKDIMSDKIIDIDECSKFCVTPNEENLPHLEAIKYMDSLRNKTLQINNCSECPFLKLDEYKGVLNCSHPKSDNLKYGGDGINERDIFIDYIHEKCPIENYAILVVANGS